MKFYHLVVTPILLTISTTFCVFVITETNGSIIVHGFPRSIGGKVERCCFVFCSPLFIPMKMEELVAENVYVKPLNIHFML